MRHNLSKRRKTHHQSPKAGVVYCDSSYEIKAAIILDADPDVATYQTHIGFWNKDGNKRITDFLVTYRDGRRKLIEIKPFRRCEEYREQIEDNRQWAAQQGYQFELWTEERLGFKSEYDATSWADRHLSETQGIDFVTARKELNRIKANRHYDRRIATDTVTFHCDYCNETHTALRLTYDRNLERNGRYICEKEGGHIAGSKPKLHLRKENPHAAEGKKECNRCHGILLLEEFGDDKTKADGKATRCKKCRSEVATAKYQQKSCVSVEM